MNASYDWLRALVPFDETPAELRDLITAHVATVDELVPLRADLAPIVVGLVVEAARHPDSDHLWVTRVDAGDGELLDVVCGAPNVTAGRRYPFAPVGTTMPGGLRIERRKIRGQTSSGMLCSARELLLGDSHEGLLELDTDAAPGTPLLRVLAAGDTRIVVDVLPNRPDLLSHAGLARELAALTGRPLALPDIPVSPDVAERQRLDDQLRDMGLELTRVAAALQTGLGLPLDAATRDGLDAVERGAGGQAIAATVDDADGCPRYAGVTLDGVTVGPSPDWLARRLEAVGSRSVNNVVDATNYVTHELGQPLHAFDADTLAGSSVVVRRARAGERIVTLDGAERTLTPEMTVIADAERPQAVAGVLGGHASEVTAGTTRLFIESASFDAARTRRTRRALGVATDASYRFERGVDRELAPVALERVVRLIRAVAGGRAVGDAVDVAASPEPERTLLVRVSRVAALLGEPVAADEIARLLRGVQFGVSPAGDPDVLCIALPSWRRDVTREADLVEEVARLRGYDAVPAVIRPFRPGTTGEDALAAAISRVRAAFVAAGLAEVRAMPFTGGDDRPHVRVSNPLAETEAFLRRDVLDSLARRAEYNLARMSGDVRLFEIGSTFEPGAAGALPRERMRAALLVMGARRPAHFTEPVPPAFDEWDARALAELAAAAAYPGEVVTLVPATSVGDLWTIRRAGDDVGAVRRASLDAPAWAKPAFGVELTLAELSAAPVEGRAAHAVARATRTWMPFVPLPSTPAADRDVTLVVPDGVAAGAVERAARSAAGELLERIELRGEYRGAELAPGMRALTWTLVFRHPERTLRDKELDGRVHAILRALEQELGVRRRG